MSWEIKGKDNQIKATVDALEYNGEWMGEVYVSVTVESPTPIDFAIGDYLIYRGERFEINYNPGKIKSAPRFAKGDAFKYENIKFNSLADELTRCDFLDIVLNDNNLHFTGLPKFSFYGGVQDLANRIQANLNRTYPNQWTVTVSPEYTGATELNVSVDTQKVWDALSILVNDFKTYFTIKGRTITIGAAGVPAAHLFKYGKGNGLYELEENAEADQAIVTRLRAYGSTRNLPHRYYNSLTGADGQKLIPDNMAVQNLMLPSFPYTTQDPYIDSVNKAALGIREGTIFFDGSQEGLEEIYPSIEGMTAEQLIAAGVPCNSTGALDVIVSAEQMTDNGVGEIDEGETQTTATPPTFKVKVKDLGFDINDHLTAETAAMSFKSGMLGGREFEIVGCEPIKGSAGKVTGYEIELNRVYDDGIKLWFPYSAYNAKPGDKFVLLHIAMPEIYIKAAAQRLLEAATAWFAKNDYSRSVYAPKVDEIFMQRQHDAAMASDGTIVSLHDTLCAGMMLLFEDDDLNINASIFIDRLTIKEGDGSIPTYEVTLKEEKTVGRLDKMQNQIDSLASGGGQGGGGYNSSQIRSLINAYGDTRFLSKVKNDRTPYKLASDLGFEVGQYLAGASGGMFGIDKTDGQSFADVFKLFVRGKAYFETLTIIEAATLAGKQYITPGGAVKCARVEEVTDKAGNVTAYRCYFLSEQDGEKTETKIVAGDQAISEMFNAKAGTSNKVSNHRWWRLVTAVDNDAYTDEATGNHYGYIDLSATDCEPGSDIPKEGDVIDQFGNRNDPTRQSAMVFSTVDADSPSIKMLAGIDSYTLADKTIIAFGRDAATGKVYFRLGDTDATQYLDYRQDTGLTLAGRLSVTSTVGDKTIEEYIKDEAKDAFGGYEYLKKALVDGASQTFGGLFLSSHIRLGEWDKSDPDNPLLTKVWAGHNGVYDPELQGRSIGSWWGGDMIDRFDAADNYLSEAGVRYASALVRMDGSAYFADGNIGFRNDGSGWLGDRQTGSCITFANGSMTFGSGIKIDIGGSASGIADTLASLLNFNVGLTSLLEPVYLAPDGTITPKGWLKASEANALQAKVGVFSNSFISAKGVSSDTGDTGGSPTTPGDSGGQGIDEAQLAQWMTDNIDRYLPKDHLTQSEGDNRYLLRTALMELATKADLTAFYTKNEANNLFLTASALSGYATKDDLSDYAKTADVYTKTLADSTFAKKATTLAGYGITDAYTKAEVNQSFAPLSSLQSYYTKAEADSRYVSKAGDTMTGALTLPALIATNSIKIGPATITYDAANKGLRFTSGIYSDDYVTARGVGPTFASEYLPLTGGTLTGNITVEGANPSLIASKTDSNSLMLNVGSTGAAGLWWKPQEGTAKWLIFMHPDGNTAQIPVSLQVSSYVQGTRLISTVATGTAPISVASSTRCANLNADLLDGIHADGLLTALSLSGSTLSLTVGGVTKSLTLPSGGGEVNTLKADGITILEAERNTSGLDRLKAQGASLDISLVAASTLVVGDNLIISNNSIENINGGGLTIGSSSNPVTSLYLGDLYVDGEKINFNNLGGGASGNFLPLAGGTLTGDLRLKDSTAYGRSLLFGDGSYCYLKEDTDDHLKVYARAGIDLSTGSGNSVTVNGSDILQSVSVSGSTLSINVAGVTKSVTLPTSGGSSGSYLPLSGGTLTGTLNIPTGTNVVNNTVLGLTTNTYNPYLRLTLNGVNYYCQAYNDSSRGAGLFLGQGSANSVRIDASGNLYIPAGAKIYRGSTVIA